MSLPIPHHRRHFLLGAAGLAAAQTAAATSTWEVGLRGGRIVVTLAAGKLSFDEIAIREWVRQAAEAVELFYGRFPVEIVHLRIRPVPERRGVFGGVTFGTHPPSIRVSVGENTRQAQLDHDWVLTHEMVHLAFPSLPRRHHWLEEGLATYVEPLARLQAGRLEPARHWREFTRDLAQGLPGAGDLGLDHTPTWARTYWGGALFCFWSDLTLREQTGNRHGLQSSLRAVVNAGGTVEEEWPLMRALRIADASTNHSVLVDLYNGWKSTPVTPDLTQTWKRLGVILRNGTVEFDDTAPLAELRGAMLRQLE